VSDQPPEIPEPIDLPVSRTFPADESFFANSEAWIEEVRGRVKAEGLISVESEHLPETDEIVMTLDVAERLPDMPWGPDAAP
jgi:hypothetical protein